MANVELKLVAVRTAVVVRELPAQITATPPAGVTPASVTWSHPTLPAAVVAPGHPATLVIPEAPAGEHVVRVTVFGLGGKAHTGVIIMKYDLA